MALLVVGLVGVGAFSTWALLSPRVYEATASVVADTTPPRVLGQEVRDVVDIGPGQYLFMQDYLQTQKRVLTSDSLARSAIARLELERDPEFWRGLGRGTNEGTEPSLDREVRDFVAAIEVDTIPHTQVITVSFRHRRPEQAKRAVDGLVDAFLERNLERRDTSNLNASRFLSDEADQLRKRLAESELALYQFKRDNDLLSVSLEDRINSESQRVDKLASALTEARLRRIARSASADEISKQASEQPGGVAAIDAPTLEGLKRDLLDEERKLGELRSRYEDAHPLVRHQQAKVQAVANGIQRETALQLRAARGRANESLAEERQIASQLAVAKEQGLRVARLELEYNRLKRESEGLARQYALVANRTKETELSAKVKENNLHVLDYARLPERAKSPRLAVGAAIALVLTVMVSLLFALFLDALDRTLKSQADVETHLGLPFLGAVPRIEAGGDLVVAAEPSSQIAEFCRMIRTNILFAGVSKPRNRLLVTSTMAGEGKTLTSVSMATVMAQAGGSVLLVDCDFRRPRLRAVFGIESEVGLSNVLLGAAPLDDVIRSTSVPNLYVLPCGPIPPDPAELIGSRKLRDLLDECGRRFERVILDSPPVSPVTDPALMAQFCDGVVLVVRAERTSYDHVQRACRTLTDVGAPLLGVVLNDLSLNRVRYGYGYRERYEYGRPKSAVPRERGSSDRAA